MVPLSGNVTVGIGVVSYAGQLNISVIADRDNCPDLPVFIGGLDRSMADLTGAAMRITPPAYAAGLPRRRGGGSARPVGPGNKVPKGPRNGGKGPYPGLPGPLSLDSDPSSR